MKEIVIRMKSIDDLNHDDEKFWDKLKKSDLLEVEFDGQVYHGLNGLKLNIRVPEVYVNFSDSDPRWICEITLEQDIAV